MNAMACADHDRRRPQLLARTISGLFPDYLVMGEHGMAEMEMPLPDNTLPLMTGDRALKARSRWGSLQ